MPSVDMINVCQAQELQEDSVGVDQSSNIWHDQTSKCTPLHGIYMARLEAGDVLWD